MSNRIRNNLALVLACWLVLTCLQVEASSHKSTSKKGKAVSAKSHVSKRHGASRASSATSSSKRVSSKRASSKKASSKSSRSRHSASRSVGRRASRSAHASSHSRFNARSHGRVRANARPITHARVNAASHPATASQGDGGPVDMGIGPRVRNYSLMARSYALYDQGINERLRGNYGSSTDKLAESVNLLDQARSNQRNGGASTLEAMVFFELAQAAEADGDFTLARDSYAHCLRAKPHYVEGYMRIVSLLATQGQLPLAMNWLKEGLKECPHDPRLNDLSTVFSTFVGGYKPALERDPEPTIKPVGPETLPIETPIETNVESSPETNPETKSVISPAVSPELP
ncbi:tetratricopeptide repeat protein [bacterium]|nr:tetratricopeptide repeat protein [bacterium]MBP9808350.1 tetratricopeptide repeat protein [bacterium]